MEIWLPACAATMIWPRLVAFGYKEQGCAANRSFNLPTRSPMLLSVEVSGELGVVVEGKVKWRKEAPPLEAPPFKMTSKIAGDVSWPLAGAGTTAEESITGTDLGPMSKPRVKGSVPPALLSIGTSL